MPMMSCAKNIEITSENFILTGDLRQKDGEGLLRDLELFRKNIFKVLGVSGEPEIIPVRVYVTKNEKGFKTITGNSGFDGLYTMTHNGPAFVLNGKNGFRRGDGARHIALHEYTHHIVSAYTEWDYPLWYNEGLANYLATFTYKDGVFRVGEPYDLYAYSLRQENWMPMSVVLGSLEKYPFSTGDTSKIGLQTKSQFYAQTWLAAHYLRHKEGYKGKLTDYIRRLNIGEQPIPAFEAAIGFSPEEFETELKTYFKKDKYNVTWFTTPDEDIPPPITRTLADQEAQFARLSAMRNFVFRPDRRASVIKAYEDYEAEFGESVDTLIAKADLTALLARKNDGYETARELADKALALEPESVEVNVISATILVHQYGRGLGGAAADMKTARKYAAKALRDDPQLPLANYSYALSFKDDYAPPENALNAAGYALDYYRDKSFMGPNLGLAGILLNGKKYDDALPPITRAINWSKDPAMRVSAQSMRKYLEVEKAR